MFAASAPRASIRELAGGASSIAFSYRIVGRRKDVRHHRRFAKIDTRLSLPAVAPRAPRKRVPTSSALRTFIARLEKEAREHAPKGARKVGRSRPPKRWSRRAAPPRFDRAIWGVTPALSACRRPLHRRLAESGKPTASPRRSPETQLVSPFACCEYIHNISRISQTRR